MNNDLISRKTALSIVEHNAFHEGREWVFRGRIMRELEEATAVDAEPVRRARWIQNKSVPSYHSCSSCHRAQKMKEACGFYILPYYCEWCGAKMDGEDDGRND